MNQLTSLEREIVTHYLERYGLDTIQYQFTLRADNTVEVNGVFTPRQLEGLCIILAVLRGFRNTKIPRAG